MVRAFSPGLSSNFCFSLLVFFFSLRLRFRFPHHQAAMIVALRQAVDYLLVRAATTPSTIAEPTHADERILNVIKSLSRANAGTFGVSRGGGNQFQPRGRPLPGWVQLLVSSSLVLCTTYVRDATKTKWSNVFCTFNVYIGSSRQVITTLISLQVCVRAQFPLGRCLLSVSLAWSDLKYFFP